MLNRKSLLAAGLITSLHVPSILGSIIFLFAILVISTLIGGGNERSGLRVAWISVVLASLALVLHYLLNLDPRYPPPADIAVLHGSMYLVLLLSLRGSIRLPSLHNFIALITVVNLALLIGSPLPFIREVVILETMGGLRFKSYFTEPAVAAIVFCLNILLIRDARSKHLRWFVIFSNVLLALVTFSGTGLVLLLVVLLNREVFKWIPAGALVSVGILVIFSISLPREFEDIILTRAERILSGDLTNSTFLRFIAPWWVVEESYHNWKIILDGVGIGGLSDFLLYNSRQFPFLQNFAGEQVFVLNNGYTIILMLLGAPLSCLLFWRMAVKLIQSKVEKRVKVFFLILPFFSGVVWSPSFWLPFVLACGSLSFSPNVSRPPRVKRSEPQVQKYRGPLCE